MSKDKSKSNSIPAVLHRKEGNILDFDILKNNKNQFEVKF